MSIETLRHDAIFSHSTFLDPIHVVGVGGVGSHVLRQLVTLGCGRVNPLHLWDADVVASHNLANQMYDPTHVGKHKLVAADEQAQRWGGITPQQHLEFVDGSQKLQGVVIACVDSMAARKVIWEGCVRQNPNVILFIEVRIDALNVLIHVVDPCDPEHIRQWERYWYPDAEAVNEVAGCGAHVAVGPTVSLAADLAVWQFIRFAAIRAGHHDVLDNQITMKMRPLETSFYRW